MAAAGGSAAVVRYLNAECNQDVNTRGPHGSTPLFFAQGDGDIAHTLIKAGALVGSLDDAGRTGE